jgi:hypothetical protein
MYSEHFVLPFNSTQNMTLISHPPAGKQMLFAVFLLLFFFMLFFDQLDTLPHGIHEWAQGDRWH